jgi:hypothetical protein
MVSEEIHLAETKAGLDLLKKLAAGVEVGDRDPRAHSYQLLLKERLAGWVSEEFVADLPNTPGHEEILLKALETIRGESNQASPRIVLVSGSGVGFQS